MAPYPTNNNPYSRPNQNGSIGPSGAPGSYGRPGMGGPGMDAGFGVNGPGRVNLNGGGFSQSRGYISSQTSLNTDSGFSVAHLILSLAAAILYAVLGELIYIFLIQGMNSILFTGVYFAGFGLLLTLFLWIASRIRKQEFRLTTILLPLLMVLLLFGLGSLFEYIYEIDPAEKVVAVTNDRYIFAIDNSSSMRQNDPNQKRIQAVNDLLKDKGDDFEFAVYAYNNICSRIRDMAPLRDGIGNLERTPSGSTNISGTLEQIVTDLENGVLSYSSGTQVILLTDGKQTNALSKLSPILDRYTALGVSISTVGLGNDLDENLLRSIADQTGGLYAKTDVSQLSSSMASVVVSSETDPLRDLLSPRVIGSGSVRFTGMRIGFVFLLCMLLTVIKLFASNSQGTPALVLISSSIGSLLAAVVLEVGFRFILIPIPIHAVFVLLAALTLTINEKTDTSTVVNAFGARGVTMEHF